MNAVSNYDKVLERWRARFITMDHAHIAKRFSLRLDAQNLYVDYFAHPFAIDRASGCVTRLDQPNAALSFDSQINLLNMFHYAVETPIASGELVPFRSVKRVYPFESAYVKTIIEPFQQRFSGHVDALQRAFAALQAKPCPQGDASGELQILPQLTMAVLFWDGDEEFPAQANMLFDSNITDFMHEENVVGIAAEAARFLEEASGLK
ncbi:MAG: DUF3786 domain-containing protein [Clostridia bacterium]|nr:DUF3786 domain-containing protein [Clostridia bacterium]MBQ8972986.1 DUF3786 domain-containing protein [Clostridia bacterium]